MFQGYKATLPEEYGKIDIVKITAFRGKELHKDEIKPFPYLTITNIANKEARLEYEWVRHGKLDVDGVLRSLVDSGIEDMVVVNVCFLMPKEVVYEKEEIEREKRQKLFQDIATGCVVTFESTFIEDWMDDQLRAKVEEVMGDQIRDFRFKQF